MLAQHFHTQGHSVCVIARRATVAPWRTVFWNGHKFDTWAQEIDGADVVINLAGRSVNCRYNERNRREIMDSRVETTRLVGRAIANAAHPPAIWMNASTATIYRHALDRPMDENSGELGGAESNAPSSWRFSIDVATNWEKAFFESATPRTRKIALRSAMTMYPSSGSIFDTLLGLVRFGLGGRAASGHQFVSWIHGLDFIRALEFLMAHEELDGAINVCAPNPVPNRDFMRILREAWGITVGLPAAQWMLEIGAIFLRTETELILKSRRVVPGRLLDANFVFDFPTWESAAQDLVRRWRANRSSRSCPITADLPTYPHPLPDL
jgi:hypothetical protein